MCVCETVLGSCIKAKKEIISLYPLGKLTLQTCVIEPYQLNIAGDYYLVPRV